MWWQYADLWSTMDLFWYKVARVRADACFATLRHHILEAYSWENHRGVDLVSSGAGGGWCVLYYFEASNSEPMCRSCGTNISHPIHPMATSCLVADWVGELRWMGFWSGGGEMRVADYSHIYVVMVYGRWIPNTYLWPIPPRAFHNELHTYVKLGNKKE